MPDFVPVLIAAVLSLIVLLIAFEGSWLVSPQKGPGLSGSKTIFLGQNFVVAYLEGEKNVASVSGEVSNGIFSVSNKNTEFNIETLGDVSEGLIKLRVLDSNYYDSLTIYLNGQEVYRGVPVGEKTITVDKSILKNDNILEIKAESSGWKIWAPTVYKIDADFFVNYLGKKTQSFMFDLTDLDVMNINNARLVMFGSKEGAGNIDASINGVEIYSGYVTAYQDFSPDLLRVGNNTLDLSTELDTKYDISSLQLILFFG
jgi:hypothetical protein